MRSRKAIESWQADHLRHLILNLERNVVLYAELLRTNAINATQIKNLEDIHKLPIIDKKIFRGRLTEDYTDRSKPLAGHWVRTSGTSGKPFTALRRSHVRAQWFGDSLQYRFLMWEKPWQLSADWAHIAHIRVLSRATRKNNIVVSVFDFLNNQQSALQQLADFHPDIIETHASLLHELARAVEKYDSPLRPHYTVSASERLSPASRLYIEKTLRCEVYDRYGLEELGTVGMECREHDGFHINSESFIVEIIDKSGNVLPEKSYGKVIITDLHNDQMPFVRYNTGDWGRISWEPCACGVGAPRLWVEGRYAAFLTLGNRTYHHFEFDAALDSFMNSVIQYQVVKRSENEVLIRIIPGPAFGDEILSRIQKNVIAVVDPSVVVRVECVANISRVPRGKSQIIVDESEKRL